MNNTATALNIVGVLSIIGGIFIGFSSYETPVVGSSVLTEENYAILFTWIAAGLVSGIMLFGFAEIIRLLQEKRDFAEKDTNSLKTIKNRLWELKNTLETAEERDFRSEYRQINKELQTNEDIQEEFRDKEIEELRKDLKSRGYGNDFIEAAIAIKKRTN